MRSVTAGLVSFREGDQADGLHGVLEGRVVVIVGSLDGKELILNTFGPGTVFGEIAFLYGRGRPARAVAREPSP